MVKPRGRRLQTSEHFHDLPGELLVQALAHVDAKHLVWCSCVSKKWNVHSTDDGIWSKKCESLWETKRYVPDRFRAELVQPGRARKAYFGAIKDSHRRRISAEELCSFDWSFRFKKNAGPFWTLDDPYWKDGKALTLQFRRDGNVVWSGTFGDMRWRFGEVSGAENNSDSPTAGNRESPGQSGTTVALRHAHMAAFPQEMVLRHSSWGFMLHSPWVLYTSFPMVAWEHDREISDRGLQKHVEAWQWAEADEYNRQQADLDDDDGD